MASARLPTHLSTRAKGKLNLIAKIVKIPQDAKGASVLRSNADNAPLLLNGFKVVEFALAASWALFARILPCFGCPQV